jgi:hypothetical protein
MHCLGVTGLMSKQGLGQRLGVCKENELPALQHMAEMPDAHNSLSYAE